MTEQRLPGGRIFGAVRVGDEVRRAAQPWTASVHQVLRHLADTGFDRAPRALGLDDQGRERLTFLPGETLGDTGPTWPDWLRSDDALRQVGGWLRAMHDATASFRPAGDAVFFTGRKWEPGLVIAHLDASPWNVVWDEGGALVGFVDWDTASPSEREGDLAFSALSFVPLLTAEIADPAGFDPADRHRRFHLLLDAYGYSGDRTAVRDAIIARVERNVAIIRELADGGAPTFEQMLPWAAQLERSGAEVAVLPAEFWMH